MVSIGGLLLRGLVIGAGGLGAVMRCGRVRVAVSGISSPGSDLTRLCERRGAEVADDADDTRRVPL